jgi:signal peptidase I
LWKRLVIGRRPKVTILRAAFMASACFVVFKFAFIGVRVEGISMEPTYHNGRINLINRLAYWRSEPKRGDVVGIRLAGHSVLYMKRIIGLPGERVAFKNDKVLINDQPLEEPYVKYRARWRIDELTLDPDEYYVVGDNRDTAPVGQGHVGGGVRRNRIVGKVLF